MLLFGNMVCSIHEWLLRIGLIIASNAEHFVIDAQCLVLSQVHKSLIVSESITDLKNPAQQFLFLSLQKLQTRDKIVNRPLRSIQESIVINAGLGISSERT